MNMEVMEKKLYEACLDGDIDALNALMKEDKLILARLSLSSCFNQTPLHLACMLGHFEFAKSLLSYKPDFASRLDSQARSPLHLASANGYADIVQMLLDHDKSMCQVQDEDGRTPLHLAVMNGQHECVREFFKVNSEHAQAEMPNLLHLCVMYNRLNILVLILDQSHGKNISNIKIDDNGNTILHYATTLRRLQIITYLVRRRRSEVDLSVVNKDGLTALDIAEKMPKDAKTMEIKELLAAAAATDETAEEISPSGEVDGTTEIQAAAGGAEANANFSNNRKPPVTKKRRKMKRDESLLIAATVIAAMAYQASINPPGGVAQQDPIEFNNLAAPPSPRYNLGPGESVLAYFHSNWSDVFWISNTISFVASLCVIFVFVSGATLKQRFFTWIIRAAMWITLTSMTVTYVFAVRAITPDTKVDRTARALIYAFLAWILLIFISTLVVVYRILSYMLRMILLIFISTSVVVYRILSYMLRMILRNLKSCMVVVYRSLRHIVRMIMPKMATNEFTAVSSNHTTYNNV